MQHNSADQNVGGGLGLVVSASSLYCVCVKGIHLAVI